MGIFTTEKNFICTNENYDNFRCLRSPIRTLKNLEKMKTTIRRCNFSTVEKISFSKDWQKERVEHCFSLDDDKLKRFPTAPKKIARTDKTVFAATTDGDMERDAVSVLS